MFSVSKKSKPKILYKIHYQFRGFPQLPDLPLNIFGLERL